MFLYGHTSRTGREKLTQQQLKSIHLRQIFDLVLSHGSVSRTFIARHVGLSPTAVASLVDELLDAGALLKVGQGDLKGAGRKPIMLKVNPSWKQIVTFQIEPDQIWFAIFDVTGSILESSAHAVRDGLYLQRMREILRSAKRLRRQKVAALCLAVPAIADGQRQRLLLNTLEIPDDHVFLEGAARLIPGAVLLVSNDSAAFAYAEKKFGSDEEIDDLVYINFTHGIGAGIIADGAIFNVNAKRTGEIGHMSVDMNGPLCICGNRGCLERMASVPAMLRAVRQQMAEGDYSILSEWTNGDPDAVDLEFFIRAYRSGDRLVEHIMDDTAQKLSVAMRNLLCVFHPREIVIGGVAHRFGQGFLEAFKGYSRGTFYWDQSYEIDIRYTTLQEYGANVGLASYYLDHELSFDALSTQPVVTVLARQEEL